LVTAQLAVSVVLLIGGGLLLRTLHGLAALDLGYDTEHTLTLRPQFTRPKTNAEQDAYYASVYAALRAVPGVKYVGGGAVPTSGQSSLVGLAVEGRAVESERLPEVRYTPASDDYFSAMSIPVVRGRAFNTDDRASAPWVAVVSQGLAKQLWPDGDPIGARVRPGPGKEWATIVGIVGDVRMGGMDAPLPSIYTSQRQDHWPAGSAIVVRADGDPGTLATSIRATVKRVDRSLVITNMRTLSEFRRGTPAIAERQLQQHLILAFALVALVVSAIGVFGVSAYAAEARRREFGIRIALGSPRERLLWLVLRDGALIAFLGAAIGMPVAWFLASRVRDVLYVVTPYDPLTAAASVGVLILVAVAASAVPARRAAAADPMIALRSD
jgi:predicted permease